MVAGGAVLQGSREETDYGYLIDDEDDAATRPTVAASAGGRPRALAHLSTPPASRGPTRAGPGASSPGSVIYELHLGTFTPEGTLDAALGRLDHLRDLGRRLRRADAGQRVQRHPQLGLRRGRSGSPSTSRTAARRPTSGSSTAATRRGSGRDPGRGLQPPRPVRQLPARCSAPTSSRAPTRGATWSTSTARDRPRCAATSSTTSGCGWRTTTSTGCGSTPCTRSTTRPTCTCSRRWRSRWPRCPRTSAGR